MQIPVGLQYKIIFKGNDSLEVYEVNKSLVSTVLIEIKVLTFLEW